MFKSYKDFCKVFDECAQGYDCIVLDTRRAAMNPTECIFYYKATFHQEPFQVGRSVFWRMSSALFQDNTDYSMDPQKVLGVTRLNLDSKDPLNDTEPSSYGSKRSRSKKDRDRELSISKKSRSKSR